MPTSCQRDSPASAEATSEAMTSGDVTSDDRTLACIDEHVGTFRVSDLFTDPFNFDGRVHDSKAQLMFGTANLRRALVVGCRYRKKSVQLLDCRGIDSYVVHGSQRGMSGRFGGCTVRGCSPSRVTGLEDGAWIFSGSTRGLYG